MQLDPTTIHLLWLPSSVRISSSNPPSLGTADANDDVFEERAGNRGGRSTTFEQPLQRCDIEHNAPDHYRSRTVVTRLHTNGSGVCMSASSAGYMMCVPHVSSDPNPTYPIHLGHCITACMHLPPKLDLWKKHTMLHDENRTQYVSNILKGCV
jgi:hypothetical protein